MGVGEGDIAVGKLELWGLRGVVGCGVVGFERGGREVGVVGLERFEKLGCVGGKPSIEMCTSFLL